MFAKWRMEHLFWSTSRFDLSSFRFKGYLKGFTLQNHLTFWCFVGRCFWVTWVKNCTIPCASPDRKTLQGTETISLLNKCQCVQIEWIYIILAEKLYNKHGSSKVEYWVNLGTIQNFSKTSTVRVAGTTARLVSKATAQQSVFDLNGMDWMDWECCWIGCFWFVPWIFEYCKLLYICKAYLRQLFV